MSNIVTLVIYPDIRLKTRSTEVTEFDNELRHTLSNMEKSAHIFHGWGLAGVQIGYMKRVIYIDYDAIVSYENNYNKRNDALRGEPLLMVNPEIIDKSTDKFVSREACLSLPGVDAEVERFRYVKAKYQDGFGKEHTIETEIPTLAACIQHETDHVNGITIAEHQSALKRNMLIKKIEKYVKNNHNLITKVDLSKVCESGCSHEHEAY